MYYQKSTGNGGIFNETQYQKKSGHLDAVSISYAHFFDYG